MTNKVIIQKTKAEILTQTTEDLKNVESEVFNKIEMDRKHFDTEFQIAIGKTEENKETIDSFNNLL